MVQIVNPLTIVKQGGGPTPVGPLDPAQVYADTRPADWLEMPTPANNEIYLLAQVPVPNQEKDPGTPLAFLCNTSAGQYQVELGTVENGAFVADSTYTELVNPGAKYITYLYYADWTTNPMTNGTHQVMVKISAASGNLTVFDGTQFISGYNSPNGTVLEFRGHAENMTQCVIGSTSIYSAWTKLVYFSLEGPNRISTTFTSMFNGCTSLTAIPALNTSSGTNFTNMFSGCVSLIAIPALNTSSGTNFTSMFSNCYSLTAIPELDISKGTNFTNMFSNCRSLIAIPELGTSRGTNFTSMFAGCSSLTAIPALDTSSGTNFTSMFSGCSSLTTISALDTSSGTNFTQMFSSCSSLTAIPELDISKGTNFTNMFSGCYSLTAIPELDTSSGTTFQQMFNGCYSLTAIPALDTSSGTNFTQMFQNCYSLTAIPTLDTSSGTNFTSMFNGCTSLTAIPALDTSSGTNFTQMFQNCYSLTAIPTLDTSSSNIFTSMFSGCYSLRYADFTDYDFTHATSSNNGNTSLQITGDGIMKIDSTWKWASGNFSTAQISTSSAGSSASTPYYVLIEDDQAMVSLGANATTVFTTNAYTYVVVPDSMYATYVADTRWATLGARLKRRSNVTLPDWYTA